jgi:hypothetical protein
VTDRLESNEQAAEELARLFEEDTPLDTQTSHPPASGASE